MMNVIEFVRAVRDMREAQRAYFKNRLRTDLIRSKELETLVDKALRDGIVSDLDIAATEPTPKQDKLF